MSRYVKEYANSVKKGYSSYKGIPSIAEKLTRIDRILAVCEGGLITEREAVWAIAQIERQE